MPAKKTNFRPRRCRRRLVLYKAIVNNIRLFSLRGVRSRSRLLCVLLKEEVNVQEPAGLFLSHPHNTKSWKGVRDLSAVSLGTERTSIIRI